MATSTPSIAVVGAHPNTARATLAFERNAKRLDARKRIHARVVHPIDTPRLLPDPLERRESRALSAIAGVRLLVGAVVIHGLVIVGFAVVSQVVGEPRTFRPPDHLKVTIVEPPREEPPPVEELQKVEGPQAPEFTPPEPPKKAKSEPQKTPPAPAPAEPTPDPAPRRVVGLSLESTVEGSGPGFAVGTTRMGATEPRAAESELAARSPGAAVPLPTSTPTTSGNPQRAATHIPTRDEKFENPQRVRPSKPAYPATLKAQNIEGDVVVSVDIAASGDVTRVTIVRSSGHVAFDEAARKAALAERFSPAKRDGQAVAFTLSYTYRFRIED